MNESSSDRLNIDVKYLRLNRMLGYMASMDHTVDIASAHSQVMDSHPSIFTDNFEVYQISKEISANSVVVVFYRLSAQATAS